MLRVVVLRVYVSCMCVVFVLVRYVHKVPYSQVLCTCVVHVRVNVCMVGAQRCRLVLGCVLLVSREVLTCFVEVRLIRHSSISACVRVCKASERGETVYQEWRDLTHWCGAEKSLEQGAEGAGGKAGDILTRDRDPISSHLSSYQMPDAPPPPPPRPLSHIHTRAHTRTDISWLVSPLPNA